MKQRSPKDRDPKSEQATAVFDGTRTEQLDDAHRVRVVAASESANGTVDFDDRGQPRWKWITELAPTASDATGTFNHLKALDNPALSLRDDSAPEAKPPTKAGYDPYATGVYPKPKIRR